jgi:23S rRNA (guanosine2251-2'-O)-methyltransferase
MTPPRGGRSSRPPRKATGRQPEGRQAAPRRGGGGGQGPAAGGGRRGGGAAGPARAAGGGGRGGSAARGLGGDQVEGRQAVRELLLAGRRRVREVWMVDEGDSAPILADIRELAAGQRVSVLPVSKGRFAAQARCEAPLGVLGMASRLN